MSSLDYQVLAKRLYSRFPLFGSCIRQRSAQALAENKSPMSVKILAEGVVKNEDRKVVAIALDALRQIRDQNSIDAFCQVWAETRNKDLTAVLKSRRYLASEPSLMVLSALKVEALDVAKNGGVEILDSLLRAIKDKDTQIAEAASDCITQLTDKKVVDILCKKWIESPNNLLEKIIQKGSYEPYESTTRALFYFLLGEWQKYEDLDFDQSLIIKAYYSADEEGKKRIADKSKAAGRIEWIKILTNSRQGFNVEEMTDEDWSSFIDILVSQPDRKEIWRFLYNAPAIWSKKLLDKLFNTSLNWYKQDEEDIVKRLLTLALASGSDDATIRLWSLPDGNHLKTLTGHTALVRSLAISPDGQVLVSVSWDKTIRLWSLPDGNHLKTLTGHTAYVTSLAISPDGKLLVSGGQDKTIRLWSLPDGNHLKTLTGHTDCVHSLSISSDSPLLVSGSRDKTIRLWSLPDGNHLKTLTGRIGAIYSLGITPDGQVLASGSDDASIRLWSLPDGNHLKTLTGHNYAVGSVAVSPDSQILVSGSKDNTIRLWNLPDGNHLKTLTGHTKSVRSLAISPDGQILVSSSDDRTIRLWNLPDGNHLKTLTDHTNNVISLAITPDGQVLASGSGDETIRLWSLPHHYPISKYTAQHISEIKLKAQDSKLSEGVRNIFKFTLALIRLRQQFDIDIEEGSSDIKFSPFDIEIEIEG
jgi:WD40 repeat protein